MPPVGWSYYSRIVPLTFINMVVSFIFKFKFKLPTASGSRVDPGFDLVSLQFYGIRSTVVMATKKGQHMYVVDWRRLALRVLASSIMMRVIYQDFLERA
jgi:hypothetical protein